MLFVYTVIDHNTTPTTINVVVESDDRDRFRKGDIITRSYLDPQALDYALCALAVNYGNLSVSGSRDEAHRAACPRATA